jgi:CRP-like cAMP-binding protein
VHLLAEDVELARGLERRRALEARQRLLARAVDLPRGRWQPGHAAMGDGRGRPAALLVLHGLLLRETTVAGHAGAELMGTGDLLRVWEDVDDEVLLPRDVTWWALAPTRVAILDQSLMLRASAWPEVLETLVERAARRPERLTVLQAVAHLTRVDDRLLALMWCLAERWGRVTPDGVVVDLRLPHRTLAAMVGARRPSVTTALGQLFDRAELERRADGTWLLRGDPPVEAMGVAEPTALAS